MTNDNVRVGARDWLARWALWSTIVASALVIVGAIYTLVTWIDDTLLNEKINTRIEEQLQDYEAGIEEQLQDYEAGIEKRLQQSSGQIARLNGRINDMPSRVRFKFQVLNQSNGPAIPAPGCPDGWAEKAQFRISHTGGSNGHGGHVRLCMQVDPTP